MECDARNLLFTVIVLVIHNSEVVQEAEPASFHVAVFLFIYLLILYDSCDVQVRVQQIHIDGVQRTKNDIITQHVKDVFTASNFDEVCVVMC